MCTDSQVLAVYDYALRHSGMISRHVARMTGIDVDTVREILNDMQREGVAVCDQYDRWTVIYKKRGV